MQVTSLLSHHEHEHHHDHEHSVVHLWQAVVGLVLVINAYVVDWLFAQGSAVASASACLGSIILGYPIVVTAIKDLRVGRLSINELVAIAVLAAFASGNYKIAGVVAFFMLTGEIIETRTAEGARLSIESLIKLTPTKARRLKPDGSEEEVAASELAVGDVIRIRPGDNVAADGVIQQRPGFVQPGHHHRRIVAGGQEGGRRGFCRHAKPDRRAGDQGQPRRRGHDAGPGARTDSGGGKNQAAHHENRGPVHGLLHAAGAGRSARSSGRSPTI